MACVNSVEFCYVEFLTSKKNLESSRTTNVELLSIFFSFFYFPLSDTMDLRHQSSAMRIIMLGEEDTHPWSATEAGNLIPATIPVDQ